MFLSREEICFTEVYEAYIIKIIYIKYHKYSLW